MDGIFGEMSWGVDRILVEMRWRRGIGRKDTYLCSHDIELNCPRSGWGGRCRLGLGTQRR